MSPVYFNVLIALGSIAVLIFVVCVATAVFYKVRYAKMESEGRTSVADGGDRTASSHYFEEMYKNENLGEVDYDSLR